jgi:riboflavin biosynthesis pyrimidine reductase
LLRIFPAPAEPAPLQGLYLDEPFAPPAERRRSFVYANYIASLDGRIALPDPRTAKTGVPRAIANGRDWRLFQELTASADAILVSGRYVRDRGQSVSARSFPIGDKPEYTDLLRWRAARGLVPQPAIVIVSASLDLPPLRSLADSGRTVYVATGEAADPQRVAAVQSQGVRVLGVGSGTRVEGRKLIEALAGESHLNIAMIGGGELLHALVADGALDRLYLTLACRLLGGTAFGTLLTGPQLGAPAGFRLQALHYDAAAEGGAAVDQLFAILDRDA